MISTVLRGRFYKIFVSPMLHKKSSASAGLFLCSKLPPTPDAAVWRQRLSRRGKNTIFVSTKKTSD